MHCLHRVRPLSAYLEIPCNPRERQAWPPARLILRCFVRVVSLVAGAPAAEAGDVAAVCRGSGSDSLRRAVRDSLPRALKIGWRDLAASDGALRSGTGHPLARARRELRPGERSAEALAGSARAARRERVEGSGAWRPLHLARTRSPGRGGSCVQGNGERRRLQAARARRGGSCVQGNGARRRLQAARARRGGNASRGAWRDGADGCGGPRGPMASRGHGRVRGTARPGGREGRRTGLAVP